MPAVTFTFLNDSNGAEKSLELDPSTSLEDARIVLGEFMTQSQAFSAPHEDEWPRRREADITLGEFAYDNKVAIVDSTIDADSPAANQPKRELSEPNGPSTDLPDPKLPSLDHQSNVELPPRREDETAPDLGHAGVAGTPDQLSTLTAAQKQHVLKENGVEFIGADSGAVNAFALVLMPNGALDWATRKGLTAGAVALDPYMGSREDVFTWSLSDVESEWQKQTVAESDAQGGIPGLFMLNTTYKHVRESAGRERTINVFFQASQFLPKGRLKLVGVRVNAEFETAVRTALSEDPKLQARKLLEVFHEFGEFVPADTVIGGRITLTSTKSVNDEALVQHELDEFRIAASARFEIEAVPVQAGAGFGTKVDSKFSQKTLNEARSLTLKVAGGNGAAAQSRNQVDTAWLSSLDHYEYWQSVGFFPGSVMPITEILPRDLKEQVLGILRSYFESQLIVKDTVLVGATHENAYGDDIAFGRRIKKVYFRWDRWMDSLRTEWKESGKTIAQKWHGGDGDMKGDGQLTLDDDEEIVAVDVWSVNLVDALVFHTNKGKRLPLSGKFGGKEADDKQPVRIAAPRVRGFSGNCAKSLDSIGLRYLELSDVAFSRGFLHAIEPYLFW